MPCALTHDDLSRLLGEEVGLVTADAPPDGSLL